MGTYCARKMLNLITICSFIIRLLDQFGYIFLEMYKLQWVSQQSVRHMIWEYNNKMGTHLSRRSGLWDFFFIFTIWWTIWIKRKQKGFSMTRNMNEIIDVVKIFMFNWYVLTYLRIVLWILFLAIGCCFRHYVGI